MTILEIAKQAGVSIGTVDRVLHKRGRVSKENIEKINAIVAESGYKANHFARHLRENKEFHIGVIIPSLSTEYGYWNDVKEGIDKAIDELSTMKVIVHYAFFDRYDASTVEKAGKELLNLPISVMILSPLIPAKFVELVKQINNIPYVFIDSSFPELPPLYDFSQDPFKAGATAARLMHLLKPDATQIITIESHLTAYNSNCRSESFMSHIKTFSRAKITKVFMDMREDVNEQLRNLYNEFGNIDGVFVVNDSVHIIGEALFQLGKKDETALIGFDLVDKNRKALISGKVDFIISQRHFTQGYDAVYAIYKHFVVETPDIQSFQTPIDIFFKENID